MHLWCRYFVNCTTQIFNWVKLQKRFPICAESEDRVPVWLPKACELGNLTKVNHKKNCEKAFFHSFLGPRGPLGTPSSVRPQEKSGSTVQLYICFTDPYNPTYSESSWHAYAYPLTPPWWQWQIHMQRQRQCQIHMQRQRQCQRRNY